MKKFTMINDLLTPWWNGTFQFLYIIGEGEGKPQSPQAMKPPQAPALPPLPPPPPHYYIERHLVTT